MSGRAARRPVPAPRTLTSAELAATPWQQEAGPFRALGHTFAVRSTDGGVGRHLAGVLAPLSDPGPAGTVYSLLAVGAGDDAGLALYQDSSLLLASTDPVVVVDALLWTINGAAVRATPEHVLVHAAAAGDGERAALFPAPSGSGKTTLVAALVQRGLHYFTDETIAIDPATTLVHPFPRSLSLKEGSWPTVAGLGLARPAELSGLGTGQWHLDPRTIGPGHLARPAPPALVVAPRYVGGAASTLEPMSRADAVVMLARSCFNLAAHGAAGLAALADVARRSSCFRLVIGDLTMAADLVEKVLLRAARGGVR